MHRSDRPFLAICNVCKNYYIGKHVVSVLKNVHIAIQQGEYVAIVGHSGAGKSTLLNIIGCIDVPSSGEYILNNRHISQLNAMQLSQVRRKEIGFIFQSFNLLPKLDIFKNVELPLIYANVNGRERKIRVQEMLERLGLWERRKHLPKEVSGGQQQRVAIARALINKPSIVLADEPTGNLDSTTTEEILSLFDELNREGHTLVIITHEKEIAMRTKRIITLSDGKIVS